MTSLRFALLLIVSQLLSHNDGLSFTQYHMLRRGNTYSASIVSLHSANIIHNELDKVNKDSDVNPFFRDIYQVKDEYRYSNAIDLVKSVNCNITCIDQTSIMGPSKLLIPYFGVDIEEIMKNIIIASKIDPVSNRDKYLLATLRGVGGGKSRMIEETRIRMGILLPNWLPIAITFNHYTDQSPSDYKWNDGQMIIAYAICTRIIATVYSISLGEAKNRMNEVLSTVDTTLEDTAKDVIVGTMRHIARRVKKDKPSIDSFVLFVDESMRFIEDAQFPTCSDPYGLLRQTILGKEVGQELKSSLVMTSLALSAFGATDSNRRIKPVVLASKLPVDRIVKDIWIPLFNSTSNDTAPIAELSLLAATVNSAPRLVEMMGLALSSEFQNTWPTNSRGKGLKDSMDAILSTYETLQAEYYSKMAFPVGKYLHALVNGQPIAVDNTVLKYVRRSTFTNSISSFNVPTDEYSIVPESSLSLLARTDSGKLLANKYEKEIKEEFEAIWNDLKTHILSERGTAKGQVLEDIFPRVLRMRLLSTHLKGRKKKQTTLMELFAIDINSIMCTAGGRPYNAANTSSSNYSFVQDGVVVVRSASAKEWLENTFELISNTNRRKKISTLKDILVRKIIVGDEVELLQIASSVNNPVDRSPWKNDIKMTLYSSLEICKLEPGNDHCDLMLFLRKLQGPMAPATYSNDEIVIPMEWKSMDEEITKTPVWQGHCWSKGSRPYRQYALFCEAVDDITEADLVGDNNGYLRALMEGRFLYVYATTHPGPCVYLTAEDLVGITTKMTKSQGVLVLNRDVTQKIMGSTIFDLYAMTRSMMK